MTVRSLQHVALAVPDPSAGRRFYEAFGLEAREEARRIAMRCHGRDQDQVVLLEAPRRRLHHLCFGTHAELLPGLKRRIEDATKYAPLEQLALSPQCGFSSTVHGNNIAVEAQRAKLRLVIETAQEVWGST